MALTSALFALMSKAPSIVQRAADKAGGWLPLAKAIGTPEAEQKSVSEQLRKAATGITKSPSFDLVDACREYLEPLVSSGEGPSRGGDRPPWSKTEIEPNGHSQTMDTAPPGGAYSPHVIVAALHDRDGRHFADRVVAVVQHFTPYRVTVNPDGSETVPEPTGV